MADGTKKPINEIKVGDKVLATNPKTGKTEPRTVLDTITSRGKKNLVQISVNQHDQRFWATRTSTGEQTISLASPQATGSAETLIATDEHPFWVAGDIGKWVAAADLRPGMWLRTSAGTQVQISAIKKWSAKDQEVHDLTVDVDHSYHAAAGETLVLVHNRCGIPGPSEHIGNVPIREYDTVSYRPTIPGFENHHAIMDAWLKNNAPGYKSRSGGSTTIALTPAHHSATKAVYRDWLQRNYGKPVGVRVDWKAMGPREILELSEEMFDAANVPQSARDTYYSELTRYLYGLR
jgi:hypothetical protein